MQEYAKNFCTSERLRTKTYLCPKDYKPDDMEISETASDTSIKDACIRYIKKYMPFIQPDLRWESPLEELTMSDTCCDDASKLDFRNLKDPRTGKFIMRLYYIK